MRKSGTIAVILAAICTVAVSCTKEVTSITVVPENVFLEIGQPYTLQAIVEPSDATFSTPVWTSDNPATVTVNGGKILAVASGSATITATADGVSATCVVTVRQLPASEPEPEPQPEKNI
ncbi:MAG: Ig domain-containing protein [Bacteroidales bacterium]|nr:Ig domain-containing protein [Bacteroidales bacterium]